MQQATNAPFRMPKEWHGQVPRQYVARHPHIHGARVPQPFNSFDTHMVVNTSTGIASQSENCAGRAASSAESLSRHNEVNDHPDRYVVVRIPDYLRGKAPPENWQKLLDDLS